MSSNEVARKFSPALGVFGLALLSWIAMTGTPKQLRSSVPPIEDDDIQVALQKNLNSRNHAAWRRSGYTPKDIFDHVQALRSPQAERRLCRELSHLPASELTLFEDELRAHHKLPCSKDFIARIQENWKRVRSAMTHKAKTQNADWTSQKVVIEKQPQLSPGEVAIFFEGEISLLATPEILRALAERKTQAHFFITGQSAQDQALLTRSISEAGHSIGSVSMNETDLTTLDLREAQNRLIEGQTSVRLSAGIHSGLFRFPFDASSPELEEFAANNRMIPLKADIDSDDYRFHHPNQIVQNVLRKLDAKKSGTILFRQKMQTALALPALLTELESRGYRNVVFVESSQSTH